MNMLDDETLRMYIEESREHLADIENDLLAIEEAGADIDEHLVNKVFRAAHSIKGGAGFMGLDNIKELGHKIESVLGLIRGREIVPNPEAINIVLLAFDKLRELINNADQSNEIDIAEHIVALTNLATASLAKEEKESMSKILDICLPDGKPVFRMSESDMSQARTGGKFIYLVEYDLIRDVHNKGKTPLQVLTAMQNSGMILETKVDVAEVGTLEQGEFSNRLPFLVLFATIMAPDVIDALFELDDQYIHLITEDMTVASRDSGQGEVEPTSEKARTKTKKSKGRKKANAKTAQAATPDPPSPCKGKRVSEEEKKEVSPRQPEIKANEDGVLNVPAGQQANPAKAVQTNNEASLRVHVSLLDSLMTLAGELVLSRNQLLQAISSREPHALEAVSQRIDLITSELQEAIMFTRMQPIGNIFNKFPRVVRDLARDLGKEVELSLEGKNVELDKTIIEAINDALTHLVRNSVDHGIESLEDRRKAGKQPLGKLLLRAYHQAGQVNIEITDDGQGLDGGKLAADAVAKGLITEEQAGMMSEKERINLIFLPGFSTAEKVTDVSGRGVGMDVVKTNLDKLGGQVDIDSQLGKGTSIRIKLPLTLAIIPSQIISTGGERYAIAQVNMDELLRIPASQVKERIERVGNADVVRLRGDLLPLIRLADVLKIERTYVDPEDGEYKADRRKSLADRRSRKSPIEAQSSTLTNDDSPPTTDNLQVITSEDRRRPSDRRFRAASAVNIVVVSAGALKYGLVVDELHDSEEIVVKPLGRHLKHCKGYAGATIMGDGRVAIILDVAGLSQVAKLTSVEGTDRATEVAREAVKSKEDAQSLLVFRSAEDEQFAVPLGLVARVEKVKAADIEQVGGKKVIQYRGGTLPLHAVDEVAQVKPLAEKEDLLVIVFLIAGREVGLLATAPVDALEVSAKFDDSTLKQPGIMGSAIIGDHTTLMVDVFGIVQTLNPDWFSQRGAAQTSDGKAATILYSEDSKFFRNQVRGFMEDEGYHVIEAEDGMVAWNLLQEHADEISLVVTDIEMPNLDGLGLAEKIREDKRYSHLPVIALTTLAGDEDIAGGKAVGIDDYQIKLDREKLMESVYSLLNG